MGWWITLGILVLLAVLPLGVSVRYDEDGALVKVIAGPIRITLFPRPKKEKKPKKEKNQKTKKQKTEKKAAAPEQKPIPQQPKPQIPAAETQPAEVKPAATEYKPAPASPETKKAPEQPEPATEQEQAKPKKKGGSVTDFLPLVKIALDFLGDFRRKLRVNVLELKIVLAGDDPCDLAVNYGRAWAALGNLLPRLERFLAIQKRDIDVECDFTAGKTTILARLDLTITLGRLLAAVFVFAFRAIVEFLKIMKKRKGGAVNEPKSS